MDNWTDGWWMVDGGRHRRTLLKALPSSGWGSDHSRSAMRPASGGSLPRTRASIEASVTAPTLCPLPAGGSATLVLRPPWTTNTDFSGTSAQAAPAPAGLLEMTAAMGSQLNTSVKRAMTVSSYLCFTSPSKP